MFVEELFEERGGHDDVSSVEGGVSDVGENKIISAVARKRTGAVAGVRKRRVRGRTKIDDVTQAEDDDIVVSKNHEKCDEKKIILDSASDVADESGDGSNDLVIDENAEEALSAEDSNNGGMSDVIINIDDLRKKSMDDLFKFGSEINAHCSLNMNKNDIVISILRRVSFMGGRLIASGVLEILNEGFGFLRSVRNNYMSCPEDIYVSPNQIRRFGLKIGDVVKGEVRAPRRNEKYFAMQKAVDINGNGINTDHYRVCFDDLTPLYPKDRLVLEIDGDDHGNALSTRIIDLVAPLGKGQRALIVAPPRTGKTILLQNIAHAISHNHPEVTLMVLLIDERPEEVTDMIRSVKGEVISSTFDESPARHVQVAEMAIERAKRLTENKKDVVILLDSITRLARAYNTVVPSSGKVLTGGVDSNALQRPKRCFGAARNLEEGGSLTIIATALIDTGSRMDEVIFEEFKGTGNSEISLDRKISDKRVFPAIDVTKSGTRKEELLFDRNTLSKVWMLRRIMMQMGSAEAIEFLRDKLKNSKTNQEFFELMNN